MNLEGALHIDVTWDCVQSSVDRGAVAERESHKLRWHARLLVAGGLKLAMVGQGPDKITGLAGIRRGDVEIVDDKIGVIDCRTVDCSEGRVWFVERDRDDEMRVLVGRRKSETVRTCGRNWWWHGQDD